MTAFGLPSHASHTATERRRRLGPRLRSIFGRGRYSVFVAFMKLLLPALAVGLLLAVFLWPQFAEEAEGFRVGVADLTQAEAGRLAMLNATLEGVDEARRPYRVTFSEAVQVGPEANDIDLNEPTADLTMEDGAWVQLTAQGGRFDRAANRLALAGGVTLYHDSGLEIVTEAAIIDLDSSSAAGDQPVKGQGPTSEFEGEGFRVEAAGDVVALEGRSRVKLWPSGGE